MRAILRRFRLDFPDGLVGDVLCGGTAIGIAVLSPIWIPYAIVGWVIRRTGARRAAP